MLARSVRGLSLMAVIAALSLGIANRSLTAEKDSADKDSPKKAAADDGGAKAEGKTKGAKSKDDGGKGRLPPHYADLIDGDQRAKIYEIQAQHDPEIKKLKEALSAAVTKRDAAVAAVLTPTQQEKLAKLQAEDKGKKGKGKMDEKDDAKTASAEKPTKKKSAEPDDSKSEK
jgi:hypothetical protein